MLPPGAAALQIREKALPTRTLLALCRELLPVCRKHGAPLLVNDRCDVALAAGLDGVHLAQASIGAADARALLGPRAMVGVSCHDLAELEAARGQADYAAWGPVFPPLSKAQVREPTGIDSLRGAVSRGVPLYALGGIGPDNAAEVRAAGAHGIAVIGSGLGAAAPGPSIAALWRAWNGK